MPLKLEIVTPDHTAYSDDVDMVVLPGTDGELGILPMHIPLMTTLKPGEITITKAGKSMHLAVGEGFVEVTPTAVNVLTDVAVESDKIDEEKVKEAMERAQARLKEQLLEGEELATVEASIQKSLAQLHIKRKRHG